MELSQCKIAIEAASGNFDYAFELLLRMQEVVQQNPEQEGDLYAQMLQRQ